jgi:hypothetical protein
MHQYLIGDERYNRWYFKMMNEKSRQLNKNNQFDFNIESGKFPDFLLMPETLNFVLITNGIKL